MKILFNALTVAHESARETYYNYAWAFCKAFPGQDYTLLVTRSELPNIIEPLKKLVRLAVYPDFVRNKYFRFPLEVVLSQFYKNYYICFNSSQYISSFKCSIEFVLNQNPATYLHTPRLIQLIDKFNSTGKKSILLSLSQSIQEISQPVHRFFTKTVVLGCGHRFKITKKDEISANPLILLSVSSYSPHKNVEYTISFACELLHKGYNIKLRIVGKWNDEDYLKKILSQIEKLGLKDHVFIVGRLTDEELAFEYKSATFLISSSYMESYGLPVMEAKAFGLPSIVMCGNGMSEVLGNDGYILTGKLSADVKSFVGAFSLKSLYTLSESCIKAAKLYEWSNYTNIIADELIMLTTDSNAQ